MVSIYLDVALACSRYRKLYELQSITSNAVKVKSRLEFQDVTGVANETR